MSQSDRIVPQDNPEENPRIEEAVIVGGQPWQLYTTDGPKPYRMRRQDVAQDIPFATAEDRAAFIATAQRIADIQGHAPALGTVAHVARQIGLVFTHNAEVL